MPVKSTTGRHIGVPVRATALLCKITVIYEFGRKRWGAKGMGGKRYKDDRDGNLSAGIIDEKLTSDMRR